MAGSKCSTKHSLNYGYRLNKDKAARFTGFTLAEITVVLVILVLLAALLLPILAQSREAGRRVMCATNLTQIGLAMRQYTDDHADFLPDSSLPNGDQNCSWVDRVYPYAKSTQIFECPDHSYGEYRTGCPPSDTVPSSDDVPMGKVTYDGSYMLNTMADTPHRIRRSEVLFPENTIQVLDGKANWLGPDPKLAPVMAMYGNNYLFMGDKEYHLVVNGEPVTGVPLLIASGLIARHGEGVNTLFVDGHVKWLNLATLTKPDHWRLDGSDNPPDPAPSPH